jgi:hypothetical protein
MENNRCLKKYGRKDKKEDLQGNQHQPGKRLLGTYREVMKVQNFPEDADSRFT